MKTLLTLLAACTALSGCAAAPSHNDPITTEIVVSNDAPGQGYRMVRKAARVGQTAVLYARSTEVDKILRPVSYTTSLVSLVFKSTGGALGRVALSSTLMPALEGEIPAVEYSAPMDLLAWA